MQIILGSQSPRRKEILDYFSLPFEQIPPLFDEEQIEFKGDPKAYTLSIATGKAQELLKRFPQATIITADTTVYFKGKIYNKPKSFEEAFQMLSELSGNWHEVFTALTVSCGQEFHCGVEETKILFNSLSPQQIHLYHQHCHSLDKAAGYGIQRAGSVIVKEIEGCYYNVMGLPINLLITLLKEVGIDLWRHLKEC